MYDIILRDVEHTLVIFLWTAILAALSGFEDGAAGSQKLEEKQGQPNRKQLEARINAFKRG